MAIRIQHRQKSDIVDDEALPEGVIKPQQYWNNDVHQALGSLAVLEWVPTATPVDNNWRSVCRSESLNLFVAVSSTGSGNQVMTSQDGFDWIIRTTPTPTKGWVSVIWVETLGLFIAAAQGGIMTSPDGITWTLETIPAANGWHDLAWSESLHLLVAVSWDGHPNQVMTSPNAHTWTLRTTPLNQQWEGVIRSDQKGLFIAGADSGVATSRMMRSTDGITWTVNTIPNITSGAWYDFLYVHSWNVFIALNRDVTSAALLISTDGITWTIAPGGQGGNNWRAMAYSPEFDLVVALSSTGRIGVMDGTPAMIVIGYAESLDWQEIAWSSTLNRFVAVGQSGVGARALRTMP